MVEGSVTIWTNLIATVVVVGAGIGQEMRPIPNKLVPANDARKDPSLVRTIKDLRAAAQAGDLAGVLKHVAANVVVDLAGTKGIPALKREWHADKSPKPLLAEVDRILSLGGRFLSPDDFVAPSMYIDFLDEDEMPSYVVVIRRSAPVFARMSSSSKVIRRCNYDVLRGMVVDRWWTEVILAGDTHGYMRASDVRTPGATRMYFNRIDGIWKVTGIYGGVD